MTSHQSQNSCTILSTFFKLCVHFLFLRMFKNNRSFALYLVQSNLPDKWGKKNKASKCLQFYFKINSSSKSSYEEKYAQVRLFLLWPPRKYLENKRKYFQLNMAICNKLCLTGNSRLFLQEFVIQRRETRQRKQQAVQMGPRPSPPDQHWGCQDTDGRQWTSSE